MNTTTVARRAVAGAATALAAGAVLLATTAPALAMDDGTDGDRGLAAASLPAGNLALGALTSAPDKKSYRAGETFTVTVPVTNEGDVADRFVLSAGYPMGLAVTGVAGLRGKGGGPDFGISANPLAPGATTEVTVAFRADNAVTDGELIFDVLPVDRHDTDETDNRVTRAVTVTDTPAPGAVQPAANTPAHDRAAPKAVRVRNLADTGSSAAPPLTIAAGLLTAGTGALLFLRRRAARR